MRTHGLNHQNKNHNDDTDDLSNSTKQYSELQKDSMLDSSLNKSRNYMEVLPKVISQDTQPHQQNLPLMIMKLAAWTIQKYLNYFNQPPQRHHLWYLYPHPQQRHRLQGLTIAKLLIKPKTPL